MIEPVETKLVTDEQGSIIAYYQIRGGATTTKIDFFNANNDYMGAIMHYSVGTKDYSSFFLTENDNSETLGNNKSFKGQEELIARKLAEGIRPHAILAELFSVEKAVQQR